MNLSPEVRVDLQTMRQGTKNLLDMGLVAPGWQQP